MKKRIWLGALLAIPVLAVLGYVGYAEAAYYRLEDRLALDVDHQQGDQAQPDTEYTLLSYNVGFLAYSADYSFFMDGGEESRARDPQACWRLSGKYLRIISSCRKWMWMLPAPGISMRWNC